MFFYQILKAWLICTQIRKFIIHTFANSHNLLAERATGGKCLRIAGKVLAFFMGQHGSAQPATPTATPTTHLRVNFRASNAEVTYTPR